MPTYSAVIPVLHTFLFLALGLSLWCVGCAAHNPYSQNGKRLLDSQSLLRDSCKEMTGVNVGDSTDTDVSGYLFISENTDTGCWRDCDGHPLEGLSGYWIRKGKPNSIGLFLCVAKCSESPCVAVREHAWKCELEALDQMASELGVNFTIRLWEH